MSLPLTLKHEVSVNIHGWVGFSLNIQTAKAEPLFTQWTSWKLKISLFFNEMYCPKKSIHFWADLLWIPLLTAVFATVCLLQLCDPRLLCDRRRRLDSRRLLPRKIQLHLQGKHFLYFFLSFLWELSLRSSHRRLRWAAMERCVRVKMKWQTCAHASWQCYSTGNKMCWQSTKVWKCFTSSMLKRKRGGWMG